MLTQSYLQGRVQEVAASKTDPQPEPPFHKSYKQLAM